MKMSIEKIIELIEVQFVEDYNEIKKFMLDTNKTLDELNIKTSYNYDSFCIDIKTNLIHLLRDVSEIEITPKIMTTALNNMIMYKVLEDINYNKEKIEIIKNN